MSDKTQGLICPWCPSKPLLSGCPHNPFKLMAENAKLKNDVIDLEARHYRVTAFVEALKALLSSEDGL